MFSGFCLKTKSSANQKIFINLCKSVEVITRAKMFSFKRLLLFNENILIIYWNLQINAPKDISEMELTKLIERNDLESAAFHFRVPMSLGEPHDELDNGITLISICWNLVFDGNIFNIKYFPTSKKLERRVWPTTFASTASSFKKWWRVQRSWASWSRLFSRVWRTKDGWND